MKGCERCGGVWTGALLCVTWAFWLSCFWWLMAVVAELPYLGMCVHGSGFGLVLEFVIGC